MSPFADDTPMNSSPPPATAPAPVRGITFDLDDTLWCGASVIRRASSSFHDFISSHAPQIAAAFPQERFNSVLMQLQREFPDKAHDYTFLRKHALHHCASLVSDPALVHECTDQQNLLVEQFVDQAFQAFLIPRSEPEFFDGVELLLQQLHALLQVPVVSPLQDKTNAAPLMGVITNGNCLFERLPSFFHTHMDFLISAESVGVAKPDAQIFDAAFVHFEPFKVTRDQIVHVGDHYVADVVGAKKAGLRTIWIDATRSKPDVFHRRDMDDHDASQYAAADAIVAHVRAVAAVVQRWNQDAANTSL